MDKPSKWFGSDHRKYLHDPLTVAFIFAMKGQKAANHAIAHILTDKFVSKADSMARQGIRLGIEKFLKDLKEFRNKKI